MKILWRYILREALSFFFINLLIFTGILFTVRLLKLTSLIVNKGVSLGQVSVVFLSLIPTFMEIAVPLAALLGAMLTFARLSGDSEIIVIRASGISLSQLIRPVLTFGIFAAALGLFVSHQLKPWGFQRLSQTLFEIARTKSTAGLEPGVFNELGEITLYAEEVDPKSGRIKNVLIDDRSQGGEPRVITAKRGKILPNPEELTITFHLEEGEIHEESEGKYVLTRFITNDLVTDADKLHGGEKEKKDRRVRELSWQELEGEKLRELDTFQEEDFSIEEASEAQQIRQRKVIFEQQSRFALPVACLLLALIGMSLGIQSPRTQRTWGAGLSVLIGVLVFLGYFALYTLSKALSEEGVISSYIVAWMPNLITLLIAIFFIRQMATERWQTISEGIENALLRIKRITSKRWRVKRRVAT